MDLLVIRHGQSEADILQVIEGRADFSLTELGMRQAALMSCIVSGDTGMHHWTIDGNSRKVVFANSLVHLG